VNLGKPAMEKQHTFVWMIITMVFSQVLHLETPRKMVQYVWIKIDRGLAIFILLITANLMLDMAGSEMALLSFIQPVNCC
jgi:hypothetical protein